MAGRIHVGTSGWHYMYWRGPFYPEKLPPSKFLSYYAERFDTSEINNSFYRLPNKETFESWKDTAGDSFIFAVKASRYLTHVRKLREPEEPLGRIYEAVKGLGSKLGPILFQLPPRWRFNPERLEIFMNTLSSQHRHAFEFRDTSWFDDRALNMLRARNAAFCIYELEGMMSPIEVTADWAYIRMHGPDGRYTGRYDTETLRGWLTRFEAWAAEGKDVYCYFDNDESGYAAINAAEMKEMIG